MKKLNAHIEAGFLRDRTETPEQRRARKLATWNAMTPKQRDYDRYVGRIPDGASHNFETEGGRLAKDQRISEGGCTCFSRPPCDFCMSLTEEEAEAYSKDGTLPKRDESWPKPRSGASLPRGGSDWFNAFAAVQDFMFDRNLWDVCDMGDRPQDTLINGLKRFLAAAPSTGEPASADLTALSNDELDAAWNANTDAALSVEQERRRIMREQIRRDQDGTKPMVEAAAPAVKEPQDDA